MSILQWVCVGPLLERAHTLRLGRRSQTDCEARRRRRAEDVPAARAEAQEQRQDERRRRYRTSWKSRAGRRTTAAQGTSRTPPCTANKVWRRDLQCARHENPIRSNWDLVLLGHAWSRWISLRVRKWRSGPRSKRALAWLRRPRPQMASATVPTTALQSSIASGSSCAVSPARYGATVNPICSH